MTPPRARTPASEATAAQTPRGRVAKLSIAPPSTCSRVIMARQNRVDLCTRYIRRLVGREHGDQLREVADGC